MIGLRALRFAASRLVPRSRTAAYLGAIVAAGGFALAITAQGVRYRELARREARILAENEALRDEIRAAEAERERLTTPERIREAAEAGGMVPGNAPPISKEKR